MFPYTQIRKWIRDACHSLKNEFLSLPEKSKDGRIGSTVNEIWYLEKIKSYLHSYEPKLEIHPSMSREWYDISIDGIPINLKLTSGGTDNAFNKLSIDYTVSGKFPEKKKLSYNEWLTSLKKEFYGMSDTREFHKEYHYLAVDKTNGRHCFKSILDIESYRSNPSNILQIYWKAEFELNNKKSIRHLKMVNKHEKIIEILKLVQNSFYQDYESKKMFMEESINWEYEKTKRRKLNHNKL